MDIGRAAGFESRTRLRAKEGCGRAARQEGIYVSSHGFCTGYVTRSYTTIVQACFGYFSPLVVIYSLEDVRRSR